MAKSANGKTAIVTGAGTGIGKATATALLADGWNTVFVGRRKNVLDEAVAEAGTSAADGAKALAVSCDVTKPAEVDALFAEVRRVHIETFRFEHQLDALRRGAIVLNQEYTHAVFPRNRVPAGTGRRPFGVNPNRTLLDLT